MDTLSIGQLAEAAGVNVETVRYYERRGLITEPPRTPAGYRQYSPADLWRLQFIGRAKRLGFTLGEIDDILGGNGERSAARVIDAARAKIDALSESMQQLSETQRRLTQLVDVCEDGDVADCVALRLVT